MTVLDSLVSTRFKEEQITAGTRPFPSLHPLDRRESGVGPARLRSPNGLLCSISLRNSGRCCSKQRIGGDEPRRSLRPRRDQTRLSVKPETSGEGSFSEGIETPPLGRPRDSLGEGLQTPLLGRPQVSTFVRRGSPDSGVRRTAVLEVTRRLFGEGLQTPAFGDERCPGDALTLRAGEAYGRRGRAAQETVTVRKPEIIFHSP